MYLGVDVGGTKVAAGLVSAAGEVSERRCVPVDQSSEESALQQVEKIIAEYCSKYAVLGVGIGVPGIADRRTGRVWAPNVRGWDQVELEKILERRLNLPVTVESDRNTTVLGEWRFGAGQGSRDIVALIVGTGIGAGVVSGGRLVTGAHDIAGAVGWIPVVFEGCIQHFEEVASGPGIQAWASRLLGDGGGGRPETLVEQAAAGDGQVQDFLERVGEVLGQGMATLVSALDPEVLVLVGGVVSAWDWLRLGAAAGFRRWCQPISAAKVRIEVSRLGVDGAILGAAAAAGYTGE